ncbi:MAG: hypothetical protein V8T62_03315 [Oscillospiraceae bacterium]
MEEKVRFQMRISPETDQRIKAAMPLANCQSQNEFVEQALLHYCGCLQAEDSANILAPELTAALRATVRDSEAHTCRLLFKLAVEVDILMHVLASGMEIDPATLDKLRGRCVQEVKTTNGGISFKDAVHYQNGL